MLLLYAILAAADATPCLMLSAPLRFLIFAADDAAFR